MAYVRAANAVTGQELRWSVLSGCTYVRHAAAGLQAACRQQGSWLHAGRLSCLRAGMLVGRSVATGCAPAGRRRGRKIKRRREGSAAKTTSLVGGAG